MMEGSLDPTSAAGSPLARHLVTGTLVGLAFGAGAGVLGWAAIARLELAGVALGTGGDRLASAFVFPSAAAALAALALLPVELLLAALELRRAAWRRLRPAWTYFVACCAWASFLFGMFRIGFVVTRAPWSAKGLAMLAGLATACGLSAVVLVAVARHRSPAARRAPSRSQMLVALLLGLAAPSAAWLGWRSLAGDDGAAAKRPSGESRASATRMNRSGGRPDVLLVSIDTLRADHLGSYGYARPTTPRLDVLAAVAVRFAEMRSVAPWTLPAHASMLTGLYPTRHGARFRSSFSFASSASSAVLARGATTLAERLAQAGYDTAAFTTTSWLSPAFGTVRGFATFEERLNEPAGSMVDRAIAWLDRAGARTESPAPTPPQFLFLHLFDVHDYRAPSADRALFASPGYGGPLLGHASSLMINGFDSLAAADLEYAIGEYDAAVHYVDRELGRLFDALAERGLYDDTLIVVTSDHGEEFWEHGGTGHGFTLYDELLRVPLIVKLPSAERAAAGSRAALASTVDITPTILDYAGVAADPGLDGRSLRDPIETGAARTRTAFAEDTYYFNSYAVFDGRWKLVNHRVPPMGLFQPRLLFANIRSFYKFRPAELFDLQRDPGERLADPAAGDPALRRALADHLAAARRPGIARPLDDTTLDNLRSLGYIN